MISYTLRTVRFYVAEAPPQGAPLLSQPAHTIPVLREIFRELDADQEHGVILALNAKLKVIGFKVISSGGMDSAVVDPRIVYRAALALGASSIIFAHNHPSGDPAPSEQDRTLTRRLVLAGEVLSLRLLDSVVLGSSSYYSAREKGEV